MASISLPTSSRNRGDSGMNVRPSSARTEGRLQTSRNTRHDEKWARSSITTITPGRTGHTGHRRSQTWARKITYSHQKPADLKDGKVDRSRQVATAEVSQSRDDKGSSNKLWVFRRARSLAHAGRMITHWTAKLPESSVNEAVHCYCVNDK